MLTKEGVLVTLLADSYLLNGQNEKHTCMAVICVREQVVDFITSQRRQLFRPQRVFILDGQKKCIR